MTDSSDTRHRERLEKERQLLVRAFPSVDLDIDARIVIVRNHKLPTGWSHAETDVLVEIPAQYPSTPPDNVGARPDLRLAGGGMPENNQGNREIEGHQWLQFSYHVESSDWHPNIELGKSSTLVDYLYGALTRFDLVS